MHKKIYSLFILLLISSWLFAQQPSHNAVTTVKTDAGHIRIADTLTAQELSTRNPIILKKELDSLINDFNLNHPRPFITMPEKVINNNTNQYILSALIAIIVLLGLIIYLVYRHQVKIQRTLAGYYEKQAQLEFNSGNKTQPMAKEKNSRSKNNSQLLENKIRDQNEEIHKLSKENEGLNRVIKEYNGIHHDYDSLRHGILKTYKVKNYPGYDITKNETLAMQGVFQTENSLAIYAYEKMMKPLLAITDMNKNSPAKLSPADREKLLDLLVSLSLLYIEYLYLRINDLSIGGKMVERIQGLSKGNGPDISMLKKLNTEFGSRALVVKMALSKVGLHELTYPVFDETNLNIQ